MWKFFTACGSAFFVFVLSVTIAHAMGRVPSSPLLWSPWSCQRHSVQYIWGLAAELNQQLSPWCRGQPICNGGQVIGAGTKKIATYGDIPQWIVSTYNVNTTYSVAQQNTYINTARHLGNANKPAGTFVSSITFFWDWAGTEYVLGADIYYRKCGSLPN